MKISICGSIAFIEEMENLAKKLKSLGFQEVFVPIGATPTHPLKEGMTAEELGIRKRELDLIRKHYYKILASDCILVANFDKKGVLGYIGGNTFLEIGYAFVLGKPIFLLNQIPDLSYTSEIEGMDPIVVHNNLEKIKEYYSL
jgi:nucleoside 2-deoxyribosyltransferase